MPSWTATLGLAALLTLTSAARSNTLAPWLLDITEPVSLLLFVEPDCAECRAAHFDLQGEAPMRVASTLAVEGYDSLFVDADEILTRTFRVTNYPTLIVLRENQEVIRQNRFVDREVVEATISALRADRVPQTWKVGIQIGTRVPGRFADFTGLVVHWQRDCDWCDREIDQVAALTALGNIPVEVVGADSTGSSEDTARLWGLPGAPMHIYLRAGVPLWIDTSFREDLVELVQRVAAEAP